MLEKFPSLEEGKNKTFFILSPGCYPEKEPVLSDRTTALSSFGGRRPQLSSCDGLKLLGAGLNPMSIMRTTRNQIYIQKAVLKRLLVTCFYGMTSRPSEKTLRGNFMPDQSK